MIKHRKLFGVFLTILICFLQIFSITSFGAESGQNSTDDLNIVRVGYVDYDGYEEGGQGEYKTGWGYEYLQKISYLTGWKYEYVYGGFTDLLEMLKTGEIDILGNVTYTEERAEYIDFSSYEQGSETYYIIAKSTNLSIKGGHPESLNGKRIAVTENSFQQELLDAWLEKNEIDAEVVLVDSGSEAIDKIENDLVDAVVLPDISSKNGFMYTTVEPIGYSSFYIGVSKKRPDLLSSLNDALYTIQTINPNYNSYVVNKYDSKISANNYYLSIDEQKWIEEHSNKIRLGYVADNLPYIGEKSDGSITGIITDLVDDLSNMYGLEIEYVEAPKAENLIDMLLTGEVDAIFPIYGDYWLAEEYNLIVSDPLLTPAMIMVFSNYGETYSIATTANRPIQKGYIEVNYPEVKIAEYEGIEQCLAAVARGEVSCTLITSNELNMVMQFEEMKTLSMAELSTIDLCFCTTKSNVPLSTILNKGIEVASKNISGLTLAQNSYMEQQDSFGIIFRKYWSLFLAVFFVIVIMGYDITHQRREKLRLENISKSDQLTSVLNRGSGEAAIRKLLSLKHSGTFFIVDADNFKMVNDKYGHQVGDEVIKAYADCLSRVFRDEDIVMRLGGDEFAAFCTVNFEDSTIEKKIDRFFDLLSNYHIDGFPDGIIKASVGIARYDNDIKESFEELYKRADRNLYTSKSMGGNCFTI